MNIQEYTPVTNCLALTIRKEHRLAVIKGAARTAVRISIKTLLYVLFLIFTNMVI